MHPRRSVTGTRSSGREGPATAVAGADVGSGSGIPEEVYRVAAYLSGPLYHIQSAVSSYGWYGVGRQRTGESGRRVCPSTKRMGDEPRRGAAGSTNSAGPRPRSAINTSGVRIRCIHRSAPGFVHQDEAGRIGHPTLLAPGQRGWQGGRVLPTRIPRRTAPGRSPLYW